MSGCAWLVVRCTVDIVVSLAAIQIDGMHIALSGELYIGLLLCTVAWTV